MSPDIPAPDISPEPQGPVPEVGAEGSTPARLSGQGAGRRPVRWPPLLAAGIVAAACAGGWWLVSSWRTLRAERDRLLQSGVVTAQQQHQQLKVLQDRSDELAKEVQRLTADQEHLLTVAKGANEERDEAVGVRSLLERMLQKTGEENRQMKSRLEPAEHELEMLRSQWDQLVKQRDTLQIDVERYKSRSKETKLTEQVSELRGKQQALEKDLREVRLKYSQASKREQILTRDLGELKDRLGRLQKEYMAKLQENESLRQEVTRLPKDVNTMAKEHERLLKDLADTHYNMGVMFTMKKDFPRAVQEFQKVVELRPDDADAHYNLGIIYAEHLPDREKALAAFRRYLQVKPQGQDASYARKYIATWRVWEGAERLE